MFIKVTKGRIYIDHMISKIMSSFNFRKRRLGARENRRRLRSGEPLIIKHGGLAAGRYFSHKDAAMNRQTSSELSERNPLKRSYYSVLRSIGEYHSAN